MGTLYAKESPNVTYPPVSPYSGTNSQSNPQVSRLTAAALRSQYMNINRGSVSTYIDSSNSACVPPSTSRISDVRRFFCLLTTFDLVFTTLLWIITAMISGYDVDSVFHKEIVNYNIHSSFFDLVMLSVWRFTIILLAYALFKISHWWVIAITTTATGAFVIAKVFIYNWSNPSHSTTASISLLVCSFVLSWTEAWFLDFKVIPSENKASLLLAQTVNERSPLIPGPSYPYSHSEDGSTFFSPPGSEEGSDNENRDIDAVSEVEWLSQDETSNRHLSPEDILCKEKANGAIDITLKLLSLSDWKFEKAYGEDVVRSKNIPTLGKVFRYNGIINFPAYKATRELFFQLDQMHRWNTTIRTARVVKKIDSCTDISYIVAEEALKGLVSCRDFVCVRTWRKVEDRLLCASIAANHPDVPENRSFIRGEQGPCLYALKPVLGHSNKSQMEWILNTNLKGWLPQSVIDQSLSTVMLDFITSFRKHCIALQEP